VVFVAVAGALSLLAACSDRAVLPEASSEPAGETPAATTAPTRPLNTPIPPAAPATPRAQDVANMPWNRDLVLYRSTDGLAFTDRTLFVERAGVPNVIRDAGGRLVAVFQWFPFDNRDAFDRVAVAFSTDEGVTWTDPAQMVISGMPETLMRPFDPTVVQLPDGRYRLYFSSNERGPQARPAIHSAISSDAVNYQFEPGARFAPTGGTVDCSVVFFQGAWHLFSHTQQANTGGGYHATSSDGLAFTQQANVNVGAGRQWIGNAVVVRGVLRYYGSGRDGLWWALSADGANWELATAPGISGGDPSVVVLASGELLLVAVGGLRADAGPAPQR